MFRDAGHGATTDSSTECPFLTKLERPVDEVLIFESDSDAALAQMISTVILQVDLVCC